MVTVVPVRHPYLDRYIETVVINTGEDSLLFDTGMPPCNRTLEKVITGTPVVFCTHGHFDHTGAHRYFQEHGARLLAHPAEFRNLADPLWQWESSFEQFRGDCTVPSDLKELFLARPPVKADNPVNDGQVFQFEDCTVKVLYTPGHSFGSVCYYLPDQGVLIAGDSLMGNGFFGGMPLYVDPVAYIASMKRLEQLAVETVYSCHEGALPGNRLAQKAREGADCALRLGEKVYTLVKTAKAGTTLGEIASHLAASEGKAAGCGTCVTVLGYLEGLRREFPLVEAISSRYHLM